MPRLRTSAAPAPGGPHEAAGVRVPDEQRRRDPLPPEAEAHEEVRRTAVTPSWPTPSKPDGGDGGEAPGRSLPPAPGRDLREDRRPDGALDGDGRVALRQRRHQGYPEGRGEGDPCHRATEARRQGGPPQSPPRGPVEEAHRRGRREARARPPQDSRAPGEVPRPRRRHLRRRERESPLYRRTDHDR